MKSLLLSTLSVFCLFMSPCYANTSIPKQAKETIANLTQAEKEFDYLKAEKLYLSNASVFIERIHPNNKPAEYVEIPAKKAYQIAMETKSQSVQRDSYNDFTDIKYEWLNGDIKVSAIKHSRLKNSRTPHIFILKEDIEGAWKIAQEYSTEYIVRQKDNPNNLKLN